METEYAKTLNDINAKNRWADDIYHGFAVIDDCPEEWREEVSEMIIIREEGADPDLDDREAVEILLGGAT